VPVVIQVGKWRKEIKLPTVAACQDTPLAAIDTDLPKSADETGGDIVHVDLPQIAITTGNSDALECLPRKLGIADKEFTTDAGSGHVHLYSGNGTNYFQAGFNGVAAATPMNDATTLWSASGSAANATTDAAKVDQYDLMFFSCEGGQNPGSKSQQAMNNIEAYSNLGGRIFMSHWHNIWIGGEQNNPSHGIASWEGVATWNFGAPQDQDDVVTFVDQTTSHGQSFAKWLMGSEVNASTTLGQVPVTGGARYTCSAIDDTADTDRFIYVDPADPTNPAGNNAKGYTSVTDLQFTTDLTLPEDQRCGKVVFSDMHVSASSHSGAGSATGYPYPSGCDADLTPQEKALAFIFFDIASCIGPIS
jgi:hypothetical protein